MNTSSHGSPIGSGSSRPTSSALPPSAAPRRPGASPSPLHFLHLSHRKLQRMSLLPPRVSRVSQLEVDLADTLRKALLIKNAMGAADVEARKRETRFVVAVNKAREWRPLRRTDASSSSSLDVIAEAPLAAPSTVVEISIVEPDMNTYDSSSSSSSSSPASSSPPSSAVSSISDEEDDAEWFERTWRELNAEEEAYTVKRQVSSRGRARAPQHPADLEEAGPSSASSAHSGPVEEEAAVELEYGSDASSEDGLHGLDDIDDELMPISDAGEDDGHAYRRESAAALAPLSPPPTPQLKPTVIYDRFYEAPPAATAAAALYNPAQIAMPFYQPAAAGPELVVGTHTQAHEADFEAVDVDADSESESECEEPITPPLSMTMDDFASSPPSPTPCGVRVREQHEVQHLEHHRGRHDDDDEGCFDFDFGGPNDMVDGKQRNLFAT